MTRAFGLVSVLAAVVIVGYLWTTSAREQGPSSPAAVQAAEQAAQAAGLSNFQQATLTLETWFAEHGTYAGAALPPAAGVVVVRADATAYCLQAGAGAAAAHMVGPGAVAPQPGSC